MTNFSDILKGMQGGSFSKSKRTTLTKEQVEKIFGYSDIVHAIEGTLVVKLKWSDDRKTAEVTVIQVLE